MGFDRNDLSAQYGQIGQYAVKPIQIKSQNCSKKSSTRSELGARDSCLILWDPV